MSLLRVAQYGGKGRTNNSKTFKYMLTGKDNINRNLEFYEQSGNQIAGIDFSYKINSKNNFIFMVNIWVRMVLILLLMMDGLEQSFHLKDLEW